MKTDEIDQILADWLLEEPLSKEQEEILQEYQGEFQSRQRFVRELKVLRQTCGDLKQRQNKMIVFQQMEQWIRNQRTVRKIRRWSIVAAVVVLFIGIGGYFWMIPQSKPVALPVITKNMILPGSPRAELILPQGEIIALDTMAREVLVLDRSTKISNENNTLIYDLQKDSGQVEYHTVRVPRGAEFNLQLADHTKVYLNAGSSLRFPNRFTGEKREVTLIGEGYFEVTKDSVRPFVVKVGELEVTVLGTAFNVNAYPECVSITTTLVEGKVQVNYGDKKQVLLPNLQLLYNKQNKQTSVRKVDTELYTSWKDGYYYFKRENLGNIMNILARWYDLEVIYEVLDLKKLEFGGRLKRYEDLNYLFRKMEETQDIEFIIDNRKIIVKRKTD